MMMTSIFKAFIFSSALLALAAADSCSDCTAVVSTIAARAMSEESLAAQGVDVTTMIKKENTEECSYHGGITLFIPRQSWLEVCAQAPQTQLHARLDFLVSGIRWLLFSGQPTGIPL